MNTNDYHDTDVEPTITVSRNYLKDLLTEIADEYEGEWATVESFRSEALRTLWYLVNEE
jgi:hypothetical protein